MHSQIAVLLNGIIICFTISWLNCCNANMVNKSININTISKNFTDELTNQ